MAQPRVWKGHIKLDKPTFTLVVSILTGAEVYLLPLLPDYLKTYSGFFGVVITAFVVWIATEGGVSSPKT